METQVNGLNNKNVKTVEKKNKKATMKFLKDGLNNMVTKTIEQKDKAVVYVNTIKEEKKKEEKMERIWETLYYID